jgi:uncharacterized membrane protein YozB (DUF420 family)
MTPTALVLVWFVLSVSVLLTGFVMSSAKNSARIFSQTLWVVAVWTLVSILGWAVYMLKL